MSYAAPASTRVELKHDLAVELLRRCGEARLPVNGSSMLPSLWPGDILEVRHEDVAKIALGQVVVFQRDARLVVHRVIRRVRRDGSTLLITRGDRRWTPDAPVSSKELLGCVEVVERGDRRFQPSLTLWARVGSIICRSEMGARALGRCMRWLQ
ncbi:MAG: S24/S26 family peptidase [Terriglobales bacterium]